MKNFFCNEGNLGRDPVLKMVPTGKDGEQKAVLEFDARFNFDKLNKQTGAYEDSGGFWATVSFWGKRAERYNKHLRGGARVLVVGELSQEEYIASKGERAGQLVTANHITAHQIGLVLLGVDSVVFSAKHKGEARPGNPDADSYSHAMDDIPLPDESAVPTDR
jgi:single-strand DNA-binding protein